MLKIAELRLDAAIWQISSISNDPRFMILHYSDRRRMESLAKQSAIEVRIVDSKKAYVPTAGYDIADPTGRAWLQIAKAVLTGQSQSPPKAIGASSGNTASSEKAAKKAEGKQPHVVASPSSKPLVKPMKKRPFEARPKTTESPLAALRRRKPPE
jgi:hypothetical protein